MTILGCRQGGVPRCRTAGGALSNDGPFGLMDPIICYSTQKPLSAFDFVYARTQNPESCICSDGIAPVCSGTRAPALCHDGSKPDRNLTRLPAYMESCRPL